MASTASLVVVYFVLPLDRLASLSPALVVPLALVGVGAVIAGQVAAIARARLPAVRAVEALGATIPLYLLIFAATYYVMGVDDAEAFSEPMDRLDSLYFTMTVFATVGFGDITPVSAAARATTTAQMAANLVVIGVGARVILGAVRLGRERAQRSEPDGHQAD